MKGTLFGIGVGPGDPELLTLKAVRLINECDVLAWPAPESGKGLALQIAEPFKCSGSGTSTLASSHQQRSFSSSRSL